jgi:hypothetical protein
MFGYVQSRTSAEWIDKVNKWIGVLSQTNTDPDIDWTSPNEKLNPINSIPKVEKLESINERKTVQNPIQLYHYFIDLN